jgi:hypothetical protein
VHVCLGGRARALEKIRGSRARTPEGFKGVGRGSRAWQPRDSRRGKRETCPAAGSSTHSGISYGLSSEKCRASEPPDIPALILDSPRSRPSIRPRRAASLETVEPPLFLALALPPDCVRPWASKETDDDE